VDQLWDYLNFFEFVAGLLKLKQITSEDLKLLFEHPLQRTADGQQIMAKLSQEGYEHLHALLRDAGFGSHLP
jgi:hypothetical protein